MKDNNTTEPAIVDAEIIIDDDDQDAGVALMRTVDAAVMGGADIEVIERLLAVHERIEANKARKAYNAAMSALRGDLPQVFKTETVDYKAKGGRVNYRHENLANMVVDLSPVMAQHGLSFRWKTDTTIPDNIHVTCVVTHADGHAEETSLSGPPDNTGSKNTIQAIASTVSYLQRYTLKAMIGIAAGKDDDGAGGAPVADPMAPVEQPRATGDASGNGAAPGDGATIDELHVARTLFPADVSNTISNNQQGRLYNLAAKNGWNNATVDGEVARVLSIKTSEIPSIGDAYEAIVRWFQNHQPGGAA